MKWEPCTGTEEIRNTQILTKDQNTVLLNVIPEMPAYR